jgi:acyl-CoA reductase-like NAD-dependent aldehyde dehydrogenase
MNQLFINGSWVDAKGGGHFDLVNPATEEKIKEISNGAAADCHLAIDAASLAFGAWSKTTAYQRAAILKKTADTIRVNVEEYAYDMVIESGKPLAEAKGEWAVAANLFEWYAEECKRSYGKTIPAVRADKRMMVIWQPMGVVGVITAWNFPAYNPARAWAAALAAGCTVVAKPSEATPLSAMHMANALTGSGLPPGVMNLIYGDAPAIGNAMLANPLLKKKRFTGSTRVGKILMDGASKTHTRLSLELGGNAPVIIFDDVDVEALAKTAVAGRIRNNGQVCIAPQRFYVHKKIYDRFAAAVTKHVQQLKSGNGFEDGTQLGPMITKAQRDSLIAIIEKAKEEIALVLTGGKIPGDKTKGYFIEPAVITNLNQKSVLARQEIFGPVLPLFAFETFDEVIAMANDTEYGLAAYLFTNDLRTALLASEQLHFGMVGVNEWTPHGTEAPFGGWNQSGQGHESGAEGLYEYMEKKLISIGGII